jgi:hypothetical protein
MTAPRSPYVGKSESAWRRVTERLIRAHPLESSEIVEVVLAAWRSIFDSTLGAGYKIGRDIHPKPQIIGFLLHELIVLEFQRRHPGVWVGETTAADKDLVYLPDPLFSIEIKTSSHKTQIFGNRSYAQPSPRSKKSKAGYYLAINFQPVKANGANWQIVQVRFGWLDHSDWIPQTAATGQQAHVRPESDRLKLVRLFPSS